jgi:hypothetical protein
LVLQEGLVVGEPLEEAGIAYDEDSDLDQRFVLLVLQVEAHPIVDSCTYTIAYHKRSRTAHRMDSYDKNSLVMQISM